MGHYRRVNPHVWKMWAGTYRGSGPAIWVVSSGGVGGRKVDGCGRGVLLATVWRFVVDADAAADPVGWGFMSPEMFAMREVHEHGGR